MKPLACFEYFAPCGGVLHCVKAGVRCFWVHAHRAGPMACWGVASTSTLLVVLRPWLVLKTLLPLAARCNGRLVLSTLDPVLERCRCTLGWSTSVLALRPLFAWSTLLVTLGVCRCALHSDTCSSCWCLGLFRVPSSSGWSVATTSTLRLVLEPWLAWSTLHLLAGRCMGRLVLSTSPLRLECCRSRFVLSTLVLVLERVFAWSTLVFALVRCRGA
jgi:hypothetical protein